MWSFYHKNNKEEFFIALWSADSKICCSIIGLARYWSFIRRKRFFSLTAMVNFSESVEVVLGDYPHALLFIQKNKKFSLNHSLTNLDRSTQNFLLCMLILIVWFWIQYSFNPYSANHDWQMTFSKHGFVFFRENNAWHYMWIICLDCRLLYNFSWHFNG